ncbi:hypothetical protein ACFYVL_09970 [Streptomyces sp. NPDC004111]|uniref:hypothetical protein n=1 Tax=Streptomyces sp. NPDC004111 TaxID=3364690 RepID=UPI003683744B
MIMELARTAIGLVAAFTVPTAFNWHSKRPWHAIFFTLVYGLLTVASSGVTRKEAVALLSVALAAACLAVLSGPATWKFPNPKSGWTKFRTAVIRRANPSKVQYAVAAVGMAAALVPLILGIGPVLRFVRQQVIGDAKVVITVSGLLIAVFGCQRLISRVVRPLIGKIKEKIESSEFDESVEDFIKAGPHVGWIERFILFAFLVSGNPAAAALVVTAKSLARFPEIQQAEKLVGDYYLLGTLVSVAVALVTSGVTRMALGMPPI